MAILPATSPITDTHRPAWKTDMQGGPIGRRTGIVKYNIICFDFVLLVLPLAR
jgi:hypothetical protein